MKEIDLHVFYVLKGGKRKKQKVMKIFRECYILKIYFKERKRKKMKKFLFTLSVCLTALFLSFTVSADSVVKITESAKDNVVLDESNE